MVAVIFTYSKELTKVQDVYVRRSLDSNSHGQNEHSYPHELSVFTISILWLLNFSIFMVYF